MLHTQFIIYYLIILIELNIGISADPHRLGQNAGTIYDLGVTAAIASSRAKKLANWLNLLEKKFE